MAFISIIGMTSCGNPYSRLPGALGLSPCHGGSLRAPFLFGRGVAGIATACGPRAWNSSLSQYPSINDVPSQSRFRVTPQQLA
jgi:hypothetical protein